MLDKRRLITGLEERRRREGEGGEGVTAEGKMAGEVFVFGIRDGGEDKVLLVVGGVGGGRQDRGGCGVTEAERVMSFAQM